MRVPASIDVIPLNIRAEARYIGD
ncbi:hypothetical protein MPC4_180078 [Methylocella tundrae]|uniref:Uncharacterized protein n=1 Tax=Methylocella tundrae TaxID=227605 RepID=A0A8B6M6F7_METTU|nr:hypothetical protein MPC4_180078 [Methylocella tundrae]